MGPSFASLQKITLPSTPGKQQGASSPAQTDLKPAVPKRSRGRVNIVRQTAHRGGKTVPAEKETLAKEIQQSCGAAGTVKEGRIEVQGDQRETVARILTNAGFQPILAGG